MSIFGHSSIYIEKQVSSLRWLIFTEARVQLLGVPFYLVYEFNQIYRRVDGRWEWDNDRREALDACMVIAPLTDEEKALLFAAYPQCAGKRPYYPRTDVWGGGRVEENTSNNRQSTLDSPVLGEDQEDKTPPEDEPDPVRKLLL